MKNRFLNSQAIVCWVFVSTLIVSLSLFSRSANAQYIDESEHREGLHEYSPSQFAIVGARVFVSATRSIEDAVLLVEDGKVRAVGSADQVSIPAGFPKIELTGKTIYPGFIDAYRDVEIASESFEADYWNQKVRPELDVLNFLKPEDTDDSARRGQGIVAMLAAPKGAIVDGKGAIAFTGGSKNNAQRILKANVGQHVILTASFRSRGGGYPNSPMGAYALARQLFYDAQWYHQSQQVTAANPKVERVEVNQSLAGLANVIDGSQPIFVETTNELFALRADRFAREFGVGLVIVGSGDEYQRLDEVSALGRPVICSLNFPTAPDVQKLTDAQSVTLETLMSWDHAPENPGRMAAAGVSMAFTARGLESTGDFLKNLKKAVKRGLDPVTALEALTENAAKILNVEDQLGTLDQGKLASFVVCDGDLFAEKTAVKETWVAGVRYEIKADLDHGLNGEWQLKVARTKGHPAIDSKITLKETEGKVSVGLFTEKKEAEKKEADEPEADKGDAATGDAEETSEAETEAEKPASDDDSEKPKRGVREKVKAESEEDGLKFDKVSLDGVILSGTIAGKQLQQDGVGQWTVVLDAQQPQVLIGRLAWPDGSTSSLTLTKQAVSDKKTDKPATDDKSDEAKSDESKPETDKATAENKDSEDDSKKVEKEKDGKDKKEAKSEFATYPVNYPFGAFGRTEMPEVANNVLLKNFTVWTSGPDGIIEGGAVLINNGLIAEVYKSLDGVTLPEGTSVIEGNGRHLSPGIIDCHSHMATDSGVNESGQAITAEVRIGDFIDCNDMTIYRQLAGGTTAANILHGSANPIGGQNQVIKLRWGMGDEALKFAEAPAGIKFALGENVKRSNGNQEQSRYPASRMGVEQLLRDAFHSANEYRMQHRQWKMRKDGLPPRVDLELQALAEIVEGQRWIHCHSYRQDEILALIRTLDDFGIQIGTFQHILEGYKVADAMQKHGAMASAFADWWAYKIEVADAIPYAGSIMHNQGVTVSFNSDDGELGRRLNHEAAKAVKYGGVDPAEALKFVTLNPARQLRVDQYVGSIEKGKHADVVVWTGSPLSTLSRVDQTWIDGRKYFDRSEEAQQRILVQQMRQTLIQKILDSGEEKSEGGRGGRRRPGGEIAGDESDLWPRFDEFCKAKGQH